MSAKWKKKIAIFHRNNLDKLLLMYRNVFVANGRNEIIRVSFFLFFFFYPLNDNGNIMLWNDFMKFRTWLYVIIIEKYSGNRLYLFTKKFVYVELEITNQINISIKEVQYLNNCIIIQNSLFFDIFILYSLTFLLSFIE